MATKATPAKAPGLRVTNTTPDRVTCAGHQWAGVSEVPAANYSERQIADLKACGSLKVEDIEVTVET
jgi:hypothetical protein